MNINLLSTEKGSLMEGFLPAGWDLERLAECCSHKAEEITERQDFWHEEFTPVPCDSFESFSVMMGHEMAMQIKGAKDRGEKLAMILPAGPMSQYRWAVYFLKQWNVSCEHLYCFNMDEWADADGNTVDDSCTGAFRKEMMDNFYIPLGELTVPKEQRNFATKDNLPHYEEKIMALKAEGAKLVTCFGIGRMFHIAFWEPHFAEDYASEEEWKRAAYRIAAKLHPLTVEQNAITSFKSNYTMVPARANTIGPGIFLKSDYVIGGCSRVFEGGASLQGVSLWATLRYKPDMWVPSSYMPTMPGKLFFNEKVADMEI